MPWKATLIPRQKFCSLRRTCAENDRPLRGADPFQLRPLPGAQQLPQQPQRRRTHIVLFGMTKEMLICIRRTVKCLLILALVFRKPERAELPSKLARAFGRATPQPGTRQHQRDALAESALKAAQRAHDRGLQHNRLQVPNTWISKAWSKEGEVGQSHPRGSQSPALPDAYCCSGPRKCLGNQGGQCLPLRAPQCLNSLCAHVPRHVRHSQALEVRSQVPTCTKPKASLCHPWSPPGRATNGAEQPAQHRTHSGVRDAKASAKASVCQLTVHAPSHSCDHQATSTDATPLADQSIAFSSMPPDRYPAADTGPMGPEEGPRMSG